METTTNPEANMTRIETLNATAVKMTRAQSTETLVQSFEHTDTLLDQAGLTHDQWLDITTSRGWIIDILDERNALHLIGLE